MDAKELLDSLTTENIIQLLVELGAQHINDLSESKGHIITNTICHNISDGSMKLYYYTEGNGKFEGKKFHCFTACGESFNIFELVKKNFVLKNVMMSFPEIIGWICSKLGLQTRGYSKPDGFGHEEDKRNEELEYLKKFNKKEMLVPELKVYDEAILKRFTDYKHDAFLSDGLTEDAQSYWEVMYSYVDHSIILPHRDKYGRLVSLKQRNLDSFKIESGYKYIPYQTFGKNGVLYSVPTQFHLYGLYQNAEYIKKIKKVFLFESEKSIIKLESWYGRQNYGLALCGSNISEWHIQEILNLGIEEVVICLDREYRDVDSEECRTYQQRILRMCRSLVNFVRVAVIVDKDGLTGYKDSPVDKTQEIFEQLCDQKQYIYTSE